MTLISRLKEFDKITKKNFLLLLVFSLIFTAIEVVSIGIIVPFINSFINQDFIKEFIFFEYLLNFIYPHSIFDFFKIEIVSSDKQNIIAFTILLVLIYLIKSLYVLFYHYFSIHFLLNLQKNLSTSLYKTYLNKDYLNFIKLKTSEIFRLVIVDTSLFISGLRAILDLFVGVLIISILIFFLLKVNFLITIYSVLLFSILSFFYLKFVKKKIINYSDTRIMSEENRIKNLNEGLSMFKQIKLSNKVKYFFDIFNEENIKFTNSVIKFDFLGKVPKIFLELVGIICIFFVIMYLVVKNNSTSEILLTLGTVSVIFVRLLPMINKFVYDIQLFNWSKSVLKSYPLKDQSSKINLSNQTSIKQDINFDKHIEFLRINFFYKERKVKILKDLNFEILKGEYIGIKGSTGTGKSTFLDLLMGLISPSEGEIKVDGKNLELNNISWHEKIGYVPQDVTLINENILKNIAFGIEENKIDMQKINKCVEIAQLKEFINQLPEKFETNIGYMSANISGGQKQRIGIARALYHDPALLIFDEATNSLDDKTEQQILDLIYNLKGKKTIIFVSHQSNPLKNCDKILDLK